MSLIRVRRDRKKDWIDIKKGIPIRVLVGLLALAVLLMWLL